MALVYNLALPQELLGFVRNIQAERDFNQFALSQFLPNQDINDITYKITTGTLTDEDAAEVRAWDVESPIGKRQGISRIMGELPPISKKKRVGEEERLRLEGLKRRGEGATSALIDAIYDDAGRLARAVSARIELFRGEALVNGTITINENSIKLDPIDFQRATAHNFAANTLLTTARWSDFANSDPIGNLSTWIDTYRTTNLGLEPGVILTSRKVLRNLLQNAKIRALAGFPVTTPSLVNRPQLNSVLSNFDLPPIATYDVAVRVGGSQVRTVADDKVILLPPAGEPLGRTFIGPTAESIELAEANQISGDQLSGLAAVVDRTTDPVSTWTKVVGVALPVLVNPNLSFVAQVL